jgi:hypothetical protein
VDADAYRASVFDLNIIKFPLQVYYSAGLAVNYKAEAAAQLSTVRIGGIPYEIKESQRTE